MSAAAGRRGRRGRARGPVEVTPLQGQRLGGRHRDRAVRLAVPDRDPRPAFGRRARRADLGAPRRGRQVGDAAHGRQGLAHAGRRAVRQPGNHGAPGEQLRVGGEHRRRHRPARGEARDKHASRVEIEVGDGPVHHLGDRGRLPRSAPRVRVLEPVEAEVGVVSPRLLRAEHGEAVPISQLEPPRPLRIAGRRLAASVQHDDQRRAGGQPWRGVEPHPQRARIGAEVGDRPDVGPPARAARRRARPGEQVRDRIPKARHRRSPDRTAG